MSVSPLGAARLLFLAERGGGVPPDEALRESTAARLPAGEDRDALVYVAWEIARGAEGIAPEEARALFLVVVACLVEERRGSTQLPLATLPARLEELGATEEDRRLALALVARAGDDPRTAGVLGRAGDRRPLLLEGDALYLERMLFHENRLATNLARRVSRPAAHRQGEPLPTCTEDEAKAALASLGATSLSEEQARAVVLAASRPLVAITGGPGTGKTSTVLAILRTLVALGVPPESILVAAPTGRAAHRLEEALRQGTTSPEDPLARCPPPETLHRVLGYDAGADRFRHHENDRLPARVVVIDEASMVDLALADALVRAVRDDARLVLLGDAHQLPSVDAGAVFRDLVQADPAGVVVRLTRSFRVADPDGGGAALLAAAGAINAGRGEQLFAGPAAKRIVHERGRVTDLRLVGVELATGEHDADLLRAFLDRWFGVRVYPTQAFADRARREHHLEAGELRGESAESARWLLEHHGRHRLLTVTRGAALRTGADAVNAYLHRAFLARHVQLGDGRIAPAFYPGEPVLVTRNDYARDLFNGDQGVILRVAARVGEGHHFMAVFPRGDRLAAFPIDAVRASLALGFAMTVHKSQGSEFDHVALILPERPMPLLTREILYTALTRARRAATVVGARTVLTSGIERRGERFSGLAKKLVST